MRPSMAVKDLHLADLHEQARELGVPRYRMLTRDELIRFFDGRVAKWWIPDDVVFLEQLPHTATGKLLKTKLREDYKEHNLPTA